MKHRSRYNPPAQALTPVYTVDGVEMPLEFVQQAPDRWSCCEWFAGSPQQTVRVRTEEWVPAAYAELWMLDRILQAQS